MSWGTPTSWSPLVDWITARRINMALGGYAVGPWEARQLDEETIEMATALTVGMPAMARGRAKVVKAFADWKADYHKRNRRRVH